MLNQKFRTDTFKIKERPSGEEDSLRMSMKQQTQGIKIDLDQSEDQDRRHSQNEKVLKKKKSKKSSQEVQYSDKKTSQKSAKKESDKSEKQIIKAVTLSIPMNKKKGTLSRDAPIEGEEQYFSHSGIKGKSSQEYFSSKDTFSPSVQKIVKSNPFEKKHSQGEVMSQQYNTYNSAQKHKNTNEGTMNEESGSYLTSILTMENEEFKTLNKLSQKMQLSDLKPIEECTPINKTTQQQVKQRNQSYTLQLQGNNPRINSATNIHNRSNMQSAQKLESILRQPITENQRLDCKFISFINIAPDQSLIDLNIHKLNFNEEKNTLMISHISTDIREIKQQYQELQKMIKDTHFCQKCESERISHQNSFRFNTKTLNTAKESPNRTQDFRFSVRTQMKDQTTSPKKSGGTSPKKQNAATSPVKKQATFGTQQFFQKSHTNSSTSPMKFSRGNSPEKSGIQVLDEQLYQQLSHIAQINPDHLEEILESISDQKIDEKNLSKMIDREKNFVILKYEVLLEKIIQAYHNLQAQDQILKIDAENKLGILHQQVQNLEYKDEQIKQLQQRVVELENKNSHHNRELSAQKSKFQVEQDSIISEKWQAEKKLQNLEQDFNNQSEQLKQQREKNQQIQEEIRQQEIGIKLQKEHLIKLETEKKVLEMENQKLKQMDEKNKIELQQFKFSSLDYEEKYHDYHGQVEMLNFNLQKKEQECEAQKWELQTIKSNIEMLSIQTQQLLMKNQYLKDQLSISQQEKSQLQYSIDSLRYQAQRESSDRIQNLRSYDLNQDEEERNAQKFLRQYLKQQNTYRPRQARSPEPISPNFNPIEGYNVVPSQPSPTSYIKPRNSKRNLLPLVQQPEFLLPSKQSYQSSTPKAERLDTGGMQRSPGGGDSPRKKQAQAYDSSQLSSILNNWPEEKKGQGSPEIVRRRNQSPYVRAALAEDRGGNVNQQSPQMPPAGKSSGLKSFQNVGQIASSVQNMLSEQLLKRQQIEEELRVIGTHPKQKEQLDRKQELELNLELTNKMISNMRGKLKEIGI